MPTAHAIGGYLGSGKTTLARRLEQDTQAVRLSIDEWLIGLSGDSVALDPSLFDRTLALLNDLWPRILLAGADVVLDFGFWRRADREAARAAAEAAGAQFLLHWVQCADDVALSRCLNRVGAAGAYEIDAQAFTDLRAKFEPLASDEDADVTVTG